MTAAVAMMIPAPIAPAMGSERPEGIAGGGICWVLVAVGSAGVEIEVLGGVGVDADIDIDVDVDMDVDVDVDVEVEVRVVDISSTSATLKESRPFDI